MNAAVTGPKRRAPRLAGIGLLAGLWAAGPALAFTDTETFTVTVTVAASCTFSVSNLHFGNYVAVQLDATAAVTVTCTNTTHYDVGIDGGLHTSGNFGWRMAGPGGALLSYKIYRDAGFTTYWGGNPGTDAVSGTGNGSAQQLTVYGRIAADQYAQQGVYTDTITFTLYY